MKKRRKQLIEDSSTAAQDAQKKATGETHEVAQRKLEQMERLKGALGMSSETKEGDAFNRELQVTMGGCHACMCGS